jgi:hypothetical protein
MGVSGAKKRASLQGILEGWQLAAMVAGDVAYRFIVPVERLKGVILCEIEATAWLRLIVNWFWSGARTRNSADVEILPRSRLNSSNPLR